MQNELGTALFFKPRREQPWLGLIHLQAPALQAGASAIDALPHHCFFKAVRN
jgi:hypothetical protein